MSAPVQPTPTADSLRIPLRCPVCHGVLAETDGGQRLYLGGALMVRYTGRLTIHCVRCEERRAHVDWYPRQLNMPRA